MTGDSIAAPATAVAKSSGPGGKRHLSDRSRAERRLAFKLVAPAAIESPVIATTLPSEQS